MDKVAQVLLNALVRYFESHPDALERLIKQIITRILDLDIDVGKNTQAAHSATPSAFMEGFGVVY